MDDCVKYVDAITGAAAGGAGVSTATGTSKQSIPASEILAVALTFSGTASPATADVTVTLLGSGGQPDQILLARANSGTADTLYPRKVAVDATGAAIAASWAKFVGSGLIKVDIAQTDVGAIVQARVYYC